MMKNRYKPELKFKYFIYILLLYIPVNLNSQTASQITTLETINSFYAEWTCANAGYLYGRDVNNRTYVLRKSETGQSFERRGNVTSLDPTFVIENRIFASSIPGVIFVLVRNSAGVFFMLKSSDGGLTFKNVFTFGEGNGIYAANSTNIRILRGILELKTDIPSGGGSGALFIGEYNVNHSRTAGSINDRVRIMKSVDNGDTWSKVVEWNTNGVNQVGHIHAMKQDPYTGEIYICTGDVNNKAGIIKWDGISPWQDNKRLSEISSMPGFKVYTGLQRYRTCDILFDENYFYAFADTQGSNNPTGSESGIWRSTKDFTSYRRMDNQIFDYDPMHVGWYGEKIGNTFIYTTSREYVNPANAWKELNTQIYISTDGENWHVAGMLNWREAEATVTKYVTNVFSYNNRIYLDCVGGAGHNSTIQCELSRKWYTNEDPVVLHPVYFVGTWNAPGNDANSGTNPDAPKLTLYSAMTSSHISAGSRVRVARGDFHEPGIHPEWSAPAIQGRGSVVIEGQGRKETHIIRSYEGNNSYGIQVEAARTLTNSNTPLIFKDLDIYLTFDGGTDHTNYVINNIDTYVKTIRCNIGNIANDNSPLVNLSNEGSKYVSENSFHIASNRPGVHKTIVRLGAANTVCNMKNCIILNAHDAFNTNFRGIDLSLKNCNFYGIEHSAVVIGSGSDFQPVIKNSIFSCATDPIINLSGNTQTGIDYNLYNREIANLIDGGHSLTGSDPSYEDPESGNFSLKSNSPCKLNGIYLTDVLYDFENIERINPPCIGAYENITPYEGPQVSVTPSSVTVRSTSGAGGQFNISSNSNWTVSTDAEWINLSSLSGNGNAIITFSTTETNPSTDSRRAILRFFSNGAAVATASVVQTGSEPFLSVTPLNITVSISGGSTSLFVNANTTWNIVAENEWITLSSLSGSGDETIELTAANNESTFARTANLTFSASGTDDVIVLISQAGQVPLLSLSADEIILEPTAGASGSFRINSNTQWIILNNQNWLEFSQSSGRGNETINITASVANTSTVPRSADITIASTGVLPVILRVSQAGEAPSLSVSPGEITFQSRIVSSADLKITSNTNWSISDPDSWVTLSTLSGTGNATVKVFASRENPFAVSRISNILVYADGLAPVTVKLIQPGLIPTPVSIVNKHPVNIFPNPVSGILNIEYNDDKFGTIYILNSRGVLLRKEKAVGPVQRIDFSGYNKGLYIIEFINPDGSSRKIRVINL